MDLIVDKDSNAILTLTERSTNFLLMERLKHGKKAKPVARTVWRLLLPYKGEAQSITTDNGSEFAEHEWITTVQRARVFCRFLLRMAERSHRKRQQADTAIS